MMIAQRLRRLWWRVLAFPRALRRAILGAAADDARIEGDTMIDAVRAQTPEADIQVSMQITASMAQIKALEQEVADGRVLPLDKELLLRQLRHNVARVRRLEAMYHPTPENMGSQRLAAFGQVGQSRGFLGSLPMPPWASVLTNPVVIGVILFSVPAAFGAVQTARLNHAKDELTQTRDALHTAETSISTLQANVAAHEQALHDAQANALATRQTIDTLERQRRAAAAAERRRQHDIQSTLSGIGDPPDFGLRDDALHFPSGNNPGAGNGGAG